MHLASQRSPELELSYRHAKLSSAADVARTCGSCLVASGQLLWPVSGSCRQLLPVAVAAVAVAASSRFWTDKVIVAPWRHLINGAGIRPTTDSDSLHACCMLFVGWFVPQRHTESGSEI